MICWCFSPAAAVSSAATLPLSLPVTAPLLPVFPPICCLTPKPPLEFRFGFDDRGPSKLHKRVAFEERLRLRPVHMSESSRLSRGCTYRLVAAVTHHGKTPADGHYTADCLVEGGTWVRFDDAR